MKFNDESHGHSFFPSVTGTNIDFYRTRKFPLVRCNEHGEKVPGTVTIMPAQGTKSYTSKTYDVFLGLIKIWLDAGKPIGKVETTPGAIVDAIGHKRGGSAYRSVFEELSCLQSTNVAWASDFQMKIEELDEETGETGLVDGISGEYEAWSLLASVTWATPKSKNGNIKPGEKIKFQFPELIINNILKKDMNPGNISARMRLGTSLARAVYSRIDSLVVSCGGYVEQSAETLVREHYLKPEKYKHKSRRRTLCESLQKHIDGSASSMNGKIIRCEMKETSNGKDWKLAFRLVDSGDKKNESEKPELPVVNDSDSTEMLAVFITKKIGHSKKNKAYYRKLARHYSYEHIHASVADALDAAEGDPDADKGKLFSWFMHKRAHDLNLQWVKKCGDDCALLKSKQLF